MLLLLPLLLPLATSACATTTKEEAPAPSPPAPPALVTSCDATQAAISAEADKKAAPYSVAEHVARNFPDGKASFLIPEWAYQKYIVDTSATHFGRSIDSAPDTHFQFALPWKRMDALVTLSKTPTGHDAKVLGDELGLPAKNFEGPFRYVTIDLRDVECVRFPVSTDPGAAKECVGDEGGACFRSGGFTTGSVAELMLIDAPVAKAVIVEIQ